MTDEQAIENVRAATVDLYEKRSEMLVQLGTMDARLRVIEDNEIERRERRANMIAGAGVFVGVAGLIAGAIL